MKRIPQSTTIAEVERRMVFCIRTKVSTARARARVVESTAKLSEARLERAQKAESKVTELRSQIDELKGRLEELTPTEDDEPDAKRARRGTASGEAGRREANGRFAALDWKLRELILAEEARRTPPSAVAANITDVLREFALEKVVSMPCMREMQRMRNELTVVSECLAAYRVALCKRIISFGFNESTKFGLGLLSSNTQIEPHDALGTSEDVVMRGACRLYRP